MKRSDVKILVHGRFYPSVGGIETVLSILAREWIKAGVRLTISTDVQPRTKDTGTFAFQVCHCPSPLRLFRLVRDHDVLLHFNVSLRALWPAIFVRKPFIAVHHGWYQVDRSGNRDWKEWLKLRIARNADANIAVSDAVANEIGIRCKIIPNPYDDEIFRNSSVTARNRELIFVGRLVSDKGLDVLIQSIRILKLSGYHPCLTVVGEGPERASLEQLTVKLGLTDQIKFCGNNTPREVADRLREHRILVIPSLWKEPFGVVALEGIACGCVVIASDGGGLPEAIGPCGVTFERGNATDLAKKIEMLMSDAEMQQQLQTRAAEHLAKHKANTVAAQYLNVIEQLLSSYD